MVEMIVTVLVELWQLAVERGLVVERGFAIERGLAVTFEVAEMGWRKAGELQPQRACEMGRRMTWELRPKCGHDLFTALRNVSSSRYKKIKFIINSHLGSY